MQPITLYRHNKGPNPWKVALILEELQIPYETKFLNFKEVKQTPFLSLNPNGRLPAIVDPNVGTGLTIWESGAIVEYLIATYDKEQLLDYSSVPEKWQLKQWLFFQVSGQAPYYGQASYFQGIHPTKIDDAISRYRDEIYRVTSVLDTVLKDRDWLVGDKCTYADLSFIAWQRFAPHFGGQDIYEKFPHAGAWMKRMEKRPSVQKVYADQDKSIIEDQ